MREKSFKEKANDITGTVTIIHPIPIFGDKMGGVESVIKNLIARGPDDLNINLIGVSADRIRHRPGMWHDCTWGDKKIRFFPVLHLSHPNRKTFIPLSLLFLLGIIIYYRRIRREIAGSLLNFHRIESTLPFLWSPESCVLCLHVDREDILNPDCETRWKKLTSLRSRFEELVFKKMTMIISVTRVWRDRYRTLFPEISDRFVFLPVGVDLNVFFPFPPDRRKAVREKFFREHNLKPTEKIIIFVGRLEGQKNPDLLIRSFHGCRELVQDLTLVIIGEGSLRPSIESTIKDMELTEKVIFLGKIETPDMIAVLNISSLAILTSSFEGRPSTILEALACGIPVVSTDVGDVRSLIKDGFNGRIVNSFDPGVIAETVFEVLNAPEKYHWTKIIDSVQLFHVDAVYAQYHQFFRELIYD